MKVLLFALYTLAVYLCSGFTLLATQDGNYIAKTIILWVYVAIVAAGIVYFTIRDNKND